jgi:hypothetical protein
MTSPYSLPDYRSRFFEYKTLTKIIGQPTIDSIAKLHREVKRNAQKVPTTLGGGQNGYLGMIIAPEIYNTTPGARAFHRPEDPGTFNPMPRRVARVTTRGAVHDENLTPEDIALQKIQYDEHLRLYNEAQAVEALLRTQIIEAIEEEYLSSLRNPTTDMIHQSIQEIFNFLKINYGQLSPQQLKEREASIDNLVYDPSTHINSVFNRIQQFQDICALVNQPKQDYQLVNHAYIIFQKVPIFHDSLMRWNKRRDNKTYEDFKTYMRSEYNELGKVGGLTIGNSSLNSANLLKEIKELKTESQVMANNMKQEIMSGLHALYMTHNETQFWEPSPIQDQDNKLNHDSTQTYQNMLAVQQNQSHTIQQLTKQLLNLQSQLNNLTMVNQNQTYQGNLKDKNPQLNIINPRTGQPYRRYCWTCGCCPHWSKNCPKKSKGHKNEATFSNRMGGSNKNCL